jgi:hypothetical protein
LSPERTESKRCKRKVIRERAGSKVRRLEFAGSMGEE